MVDETEEAAPRRLRYATPSDEPEAPVASGRRKPAYHNSVTRPGAREAWSDSPDNPLSASFVPLTKRTERGIARWWALKARRQARDTHGVFDP